MTKRVALALSGGVDSSLCAFLLKKMGYEVTAFFMKNWNDGDPHCPTERDYQDVMRVAAKLDIPFYTVNMEEAYFERVFSFFLEGLKAGVTPNPDVLCNSQIKFDLLFEKAMELGFDALATGHYARVGDDGALLRGVDSTKDQSYFLSAVPKDRFKKVLFPVGAMKKSEVRALAEKENIPTAKKPDSTGICFVGERRFSDFIKTHIPKAPGRFIDENGKELGHHLGLHLYTIGQRKGLELGGGAGEPWFVADKDPSSGDILIVQGENHPLLYKKELTAFAPHWLCDTPSFPLRCSAKVRYRSPDVPVTVELVEGRLLHVIFESPQRAITPGQTLVFYDGERCLGSATIALGNFVNHKDNKLCSLESI